MKKYTINCFKVRLLLHNMEERNDETNNKCSTCCTFNITSIKMMSQTNNLLHKKLIYNQAKSLKQNTICVMAVIFGVSYVGNL